MNVTAVLFFGLLTIVAAWPLSEVADRSWRSVGIGRSLRSPQFPPLAPPPQDAALGAPQWPGFPPPPPPQPGFPFGGGGGFPPMPGFPFGGGADAGASPFGGMGSPISNVASQTSNAVANDGGTAISKGESNANLNLGGGPIPGGAPVPGGAPIPGAVPKPCGTPKEEEKKPEEKKEGEEKKDEKKPEEKKEEEKKDEAKEEKKDEKKDDEKKD